MDRGAGGEHHPRAQHRLLLHQHALDDDAAAPDERAVLDDDRPRPGRLEHPAQADTAGEVHAASDLRAGTDRGPGVDHAARADARADVHVAWHHDRALLHVRAVPDHSGRDDPEVAELLLGRDLVEELEVAGGVGLALRQGEEQIDGLLDPAVDLPALLSLLRDAKGTLIQPVHHLADRVRLTLQRSAVPLCFLHGRPEGVGGGVGPSQLFCRGVLHPRAR